MKAPSAGAALAPAAGVPHLLMAALLTLPTGAGKTWLALQAAREALIGGGRVLVLVPLEALAAEVAVTWGEALPDFAVRHDTTDTRNRTAYCEVEVLIMTAERADLLTCAGRRHQGWVSRIGLIVADELHLSVDIPSASAVGCLLRRSLREAQP